MRALLAVVLTAVAAPQTHGIPAAHVEAERAISPSQSLNLAECNRQSPRLTPQLNARPVSFQHRDGSLVRCSCQSAAEVLLGRLPSRGGTKEGLQQQASLRKGGEALPRSTTLTAVHKSVAGNLVMWTAIVGGVLLCSRTKLKDEEGARYGLFPYQCCEQSKRARNQFILSCYILRSIRIYLSLIHI